MPIAPRKAAAAPIQASPEAIERFIDGAPDAKPQSIAPEANHRAPKATGRKSKSQCAQPKPNFPKLHEGRTTVAMNVTIEPDLLEALDAHCQEVRMKRSTFISQMLREFLSVR